MDYLEKAKNQFEYAKKIKDTFCKFNLLWISFNCYYNGLYNKKNSDRRNIELIKVNEDLKRIFISLDSNGKEDFFNIIKNRRGGDGGVMNLKEEQVIKYLCRDCFPEYIEIIYTIRNNQFHGGKDPFDENDTELLGKSVISFEAFLSLLFGSY